MRFPKIATLVALVSMLVFVSSCAFGSHDPTTSPSEPGPSNGSSPNGEFPGPDTVGSAIREFCARNPGTEYQPGFVLEVEDGYYLVELMQEEWTGRLYLWVREDGKDVKSAAGSGSRAVFEKYEKGMAWFLCSVVADSLTVFPYYLVVRVGEDQGTTAPWYKTPRGETYELSSAGLSYGLERVNASERHIDLPFQIKGPGPDGVMAGGPRPPKAVVTESGRQVRLVFSDVIASTPAVEGIHAFKSPYAKTEEVLTRSGHLEIVLAVTGKYAIVLQTNDGETTPTSWQILFGPA